MDKKRILWIDNTKAIGIFLVMLAHHKINPSYMQYIYSFHMPLFFFISGYLFNSAKYPDFKGFLKRKLKTLVLPYFIFAFTSFLFWLLIVRKLSIHGESLKIPPIKPFLDIFHSNRFGNLKLPLDTVVWFLTCLFVVEILFWIINTISLNKITSMLFILGSAILGYMGSLFMPFRLPWSIDIALTAVVFYGIGYIFKEKLDKLTDFTANKNLAAVIPFVILSIVFCFVNGRVDMYSNYYGNILFYYLSALSGIIFVITLCKKIPQNKLLQYIGKNTIVILGLSSVSLFVIRGVFYLIYSRLPNLSNISIVVGLLMSFLQIAFLLPAIYIINSFFPFILGRGKL